MSVSSAWQALLTQPLLIWRKQPTSAARHAGSTWIQTPARSAQLIQITVPQRQTSLRTTTMEQRINVSTALLWVRIQQLSHHSSSISIATLRAATTWMLVATLSARRRPLLAPELTRTHMWIR